MKNFLFLLAVFFGACSDKGAPQFHSGCQTQEVKGVKMEYCLLNGAMQPVSELVEFSDFFVRFTLTNRTDQTYYFYPNFANRKGSDFCTVFDAQGMRVGKPYRLTAVNLIGPAGWSLKPGESYSFVQKWFDRESRTWMHGHYEGTGQGPLRVGEYSLAFTEDFTFEAPEGKPTLDLGILNFEINFKVVSNNNLIIN